VREVYSSRNSLLGALRAPHGCRGGHGTAPFQWRMQHREKCALSVSPCSTCPALLPDVAEPDLEQHRVPGGLPRVPGVRVLGCPFDTDRAVERLSGVSSASRTAIASATGARVLRRYSGRSRSWMYSAASSARTSAEGHCSQRSSPRRMARTMPKWHSGECGPMRPGGSRQRASRQNADGPRRDSLPDKAVVLCTMSAYHCHP
jgi:hypothetical protein